MANVAKGKPAQAEPAAEPVLDKKRGRKKEAAAVKAGGKEKGKKQKEKREMTPLRAALITALLFLILLTTAAALIFFNVARSKEYAMAFLQIGDHPYQSQIDELSALQEQIRVESLALSETQQSIVEKAEEIDAREKGNALREIALSERTAELDAKEQAISDTTAELERVVQIYETLTAPTAAKILTAMDDVDEVVLILNNMKPEAVSAILSSMDADYAARISFRMLGN